MNNFDKCRRRCLSRILLALMPGAPRLIYLSPNDLVVLPPNDGRVAVMDAFCEHGCAQLLGSYCPDFQLPRNASDAQRFDAAYTQFFDTLDEDLRELLLDWSEADLDGLGNALFARVSKVSPPGWTVAAVPDFLDALTATARRGSGAVLRLYLELCGAQGAA